MSDSQHKREDPASIRKRLRNRVLGGSVRLDSMTADELAAAQELIFQGEAKIVESACKPYLAAELDQTRGGYFYRDILQEVYRDIQEAFARFSHGEKDQHRR